MTLGDLINVCVRDHNVTIETVGTGVPFHFWDYDIPEIPADLLDLEVLRVSAINDSCLYVKVFKRR